MTVQAHLSVTHRDTSPNGMEHVYLEAKAGETFKPFGNHPHADPALRSMVQDEIRNTGDDVVVDRIEIIIHGRALGLQVGDRLAPVNMDFAVQPRPKKMDPRTEGS